MYIIQYSYQLDVKGLLLSLQKTFIVNNFRFCVLTTRENNNCVCELFELKIEMFCKFSICIK